MTCKPDDFFNVMKTRRAIRSYTGEPVADDDLWKIAQAGRWASSGGNLHPHRFLIARDPDRIRLVRSFAPGMLVMPTALIVIITDENQIDREFIRIDENYVNWIDVGTAAMNMQNMAHALGLGSCPVTSFSTSGVRAALNLPERFTPELLLMFGHPKPVERGLNPNAPAPMKTRDITCWEEWGQHDPS